MDITLDPVSPKVRDMVNKGFGALERGNLDYAIDMLTAAATQEPGCLRARKYLRAAEIKKFKAAPSNHALNLVSLLPQVVQLYLLLSQQGKGLESLAIAEKLLRRDPLNLIFINLFVKAAEQADCPDIAVSTLQQAHEFHPQDVNLRLKLGELYLKTNQPRLARELFEKLAEERPNDMKILKDLKDAMALDSMDKGGWTQGGEGKDGYRKMLRDEGKSVILEQTDKAIKSETDIQSLIADTLKKIEREPANINYRRHLANLYLSIKEFDKGIETLEAAQQTASGRDPQVDAAIASARIAKFEHEIDTLEREGKTAEAAARTAEKDQFEFENLRERVTRYPNDLQLRFDYGLALFARQDITEAIQQFQISQRSPAERIRSLHYIGQCFRLKKQYDLAAEQLAKAASEIQGMTDLRKEIIYELGQVYEETGDMEKAVEQYKAIYQVDLGYKDVAKKIEKGYTP